MMRSLFRLVLLAAMLCLALQIARADRGPEPVFHIKTFVSPSGEYLWELDPSTHTAKGEGRYRVFRRGELLWSGKLAFTLYNATVTDTGLIAGYAHTMGIRAWKPTVYGDFIVAMIEPNGRLRLCDSKPRKRPGEADHLLDVIEDADPEPFGLGLIIDEPGDRLIVRVRMIARTSGSQWWTYRLSTGSFVEKQIIPKDKRVRSAISLPGTPLILTHCPFSSSDVNVRDASGFALFDASMNEVWSLAWENNLKPNVGADDAVRRLSWEILDNKRSAILECRKDGSFDLLSVSSLERVSFVVRLDSSSGVWTVKETGRSSYGVPKTSRAELPPPSRNETIKFLESYALQISNQASEKKEGTGSQGKEAPPSLDELGCDFPAKMDDKAWFYAKDRRAGAVHVFDERGKWKRLLKPPQGNRNNGGNEFEVATDGTVYLKENTERPFECSSYVMFPLGLRVSSELRLVLGLERNRIYALPKLERLLVLYDNGAFLLDDWHTVHRHIARLPDRSWLMRPHRAYVAPDGSFLLRTGDIGTMDTKLSLFSPDGDPVRMLALPFDVTAYPFAFSGDFLVCWRKQELYFFDAEGWLVIRQPIPPMVEKDGSLSLFITHQGRELRIVFGNGMVHRFEMPKP